MNARLFQIPLYKLFVVVALFAIFFRIRQSAPDGGDLALPAICGAIASLYVLFRQSSIVTVLLVGMVGGIVGFNLGSVHYKSQETDLAAAFTGAAICGAIGLAVGFVVIASRKWDAHERWARTLGRLPRTELQKSADRTGDANTAP